MDGRKAGLYRIEGIRKKSMDEKKDGYGGKNNLERGGKCGKEKTLTPEQKAADKTGQTAAVFFQAHPAVA